MKRITKQTYERRYFATVTSYTIHVTLHDASQSEYAGLKAAMIERGFGPTKGQPAKGAGFVYTSDLPLESVLRSVEAIAKRTGMHFTVIVNDPGGKGAGLAG